MKHSLGELTETWRSRAEAYVAKDEQLAFGLEPRRAATSCRCFTLTISARRSSTMPLRRSSRPWPSTMPPTGARTFWPRLIGLCTECASRLLIDRVAVTEQITELAVARSVVPQPAGDAHAIIRTSEADSVQQPVSLGQKVLATVGG